MKSPSAGPTALVEDGDRITLDIPARTHTLEVPNEELTRRVETRAPPLRTRYGSLVLIEVTQADEGCDFRFHHHGAPTQEPAIH